jgi:hypothetical protein
MRTMLEKKSIHIIDNLSYASKEISQKAKQDDTSFFFFFDFFFFFFFLCEAPVAYFGVGFFGPRAILVLSIL